MKTQVLRPTNILLCMKIIRLNNYFNNYFILLFNMDRSYSDYIDIIDEVENIEQVIITDNKIKKCCYYSLELIKLGIQYIKNKNVNININGKKEKE